MKILQTNADDKIFAYERSIGEDKVIVVLNFSNHEISTSIESNNLKNVFANEQIQSDELLMMPWDYRVFTN